MAQNTIADILESKKVKEIWSVSPSTSVYEALSKMAEKNIGALVVLEGDRLAGIFSERDYARKIVLQGKSSLDTPVSEVMTAEVVTVEPGTTVDRSMALITRHHIRHLPVVQSGRVVGIISIGDLVKAIIEGKEEYIDELANFIQEKSYDREI